MTIASPGTVSLSGTVNAAATQLGSYVFSDDIQIMDITAHGTYLITYPSRLAGLTLSSDQVRYYVLNNSGKLSRLILNDVTGDGYQYGILTKVSNNYSSTSLDMTGLYSYIIGVQPARILRQICFSGSPPGRHCLSSAAAAL